MSAESEIVNLLSENVAFLGVQGDVVLAQALENNAQVFQMIHGVIRKDESTVQIHNNEDRIFASSVFMHLALPNRINISRIFGM